MKKLFCLTTMLFIAPFLALSQDYERHTGVTASGDASFKVETGYPMASLDFAVIVGHCPGTNAVNGKVLEVNICGEKTYYATMGAYTNTTLRDVAISDDGSLYHFGTVGFTHTYANPTDNEIVFMLLTGAGASVSEYSLTIGGGSSDDEAFGTISIPSGASNTVSYLICGTTDVTGVDKDAFVMRIDVNTSSWTHTIPWVTLIGGSGGDDIAFGMAYDASLSTTYGYVTGGTTSMVINSSAYDVFVSEIDLSTGAVNNQVIYDFNTNQFGRSIDYDPTGNTLVVSGQTINGGNPDGFVMAVDPNSGLAPQSVTMIQTSNYDDVFDQVYNPNVSSPGTTLAGLYNDISSGLARQGFITHFDFSTPSTPVVVYSNQVGYSTIQEYIFGLDWDDTYSQNIINGVTNYPGNTDIYYLSLDVNGGSASGCAFTFSPSYPTPSIVYSTDLTSTSTSFSDANGPRYYDADDKMILLCGNTCRRMNPDGIPSSEQANQILLSPVPASATLKVEFQGDWTGDMEVLDLAGRNVMSKTISGAVQEVDISNLNAGVYFIRRQALNGTWLQEKFIKQ